MGFLSKFNFLTYNIDGLLSKMCDSTFLNFVNDYDIVCLVETFMPENTLPQKIFPSFKVFFTPAFKLSKQGRCSGGVIVLVKKTFVPFIEEIKTNANNMITLHIRIEINRMVKSLIFVATYIQPVGSTYYENVINKNGINIF